MSIECYESQCEYHNGDEPFCDQEECQYPTVFVSCPYCGRKVNEDLIERPVDYCHHD